MNEDFSPSDREVRRINTLTDEVQFRETLSLAQQVCLGHELPPAQHETPGNSEAKVIAALGTTGLRHAIDEAAGIPKIVTPAGMDYAPAIEPESLIVPHPAAMPEHYSDGMNPEIAAEAKQLGEQLLETAYRCLGQDVHDKIRELKVATTQDEQLHAIAWLKRRLNALYMRKDDENNIGSDMVSYHPTRLSPKIIGVYPHTNVDPTCLSTSVIAASFFEQANLPHLHAGVMQTAAEQEQMAAVEHFAQDAHFCAEQVRDAHAPWFYEYNFHNSYYAMLLAQYHAMRPDSTHASNLVKLNDGWTLLDANFHVTAPLSEQDSQQIDRIHADLAEFHPVAPGLELTYYSRCPATNQQDFQPSFLDDERDSAVEIDIAIQKYCTILAQEDESVIEKLYQVCAADFRYRIENNTHLTPHVRKLLLRAFDSMSRSSFYEHIEALALQQTPIDEVQARCRTDHDFLQRRASDVSNTWIVVEDDITEEARRLATEEKFDNAPHSALEVGLPAQRLGFAVLKEFDTYFDNGISPSFWMNNWASRTASAHAIIDTTPPDSSPPTTPIQCDPQFESDSQDIVDNTIPYGTETTPRPGQHELAEAHAKMLCATGLHYSKDTDIIKKFLQSTERNEDHEAHQAEEAR